MSPPLVRIYDCNPHERLTALVSSQKESSQFSSRGETSAREICAQSSNEVIASAEALQTTIYKSLTSTYAHLIMRVFSRLLATPTAAGSTSGLKPAPLALLPPIPLYRRLLRTHRNFLPKEMRLLGDEYVKSEFRSHRNVENPVHIVSLSSPSSLPCP